MTTHSREERCVQVDSLLAYYNSSLGVNSGDNVGYRLQEKSQSRNPFNPVKIMLTNPPVAPKD
jgi:hypothetical protein